MMEKALESSYFVYLVLLNFYQSAVAEQSIHKVIGHQIIVCNIQSNYCLNFPKVIGNFSDPAQPLPTSTTHFSENV